MHWHSHWERVFGKARGRKRYIQLSRLKSKKQKKKKIVKSQFVKLAIKSIQKPSLNEQRSKKKQTAMDAARMEPEGYLTTTVPPIKQTNKQERTEAEAWKQILEKRVSKFFNKATAPVNRYVKFQKLSSFKTVETRNSIDIFHRDFWFEYCTIYIGHCSSYIVVLLILFPSEIASNILILWPHTSAEFLSTWPGFQFLHVQPKVYTYQISLQKWENKIR